MKRVFGKSTHSPDSGTFGDCLQACIASLLDMELDQVPHFMHDGCSGEEGLKRVQAFLIPRGMAVVVLAVPPDQKFNSPICHLMGGTNGHGDAHVVVACDMEPIHNPDLVSNDFGDPATWIKPYDEGFEVWLIVHTSRPAQFAELLVKKPEEATV